MRLDNLTIADALSKIAAKTPTPGGGTVAPLVASIAVALSEMVLQFSQGKKSLVEHESLHCEAIQAAQQYRRTALDLAEADAKAYGQLNALWKLERDDPTRIAQWADAVVAAIDAPMRVIHLCAEMIELIERLVGKTNTSLGSDLAIAAVLTEAAARAAAWNVRINLPLIDDGEVKRAYEHEMAEALGQIQQKCETIEHELSSGE